MKIKIEFDRDEIEEIIKAHALKTFPVEVNGKDVYLSEEYGGFKVYIDDKIEPLEESKEAIDEEFISPD